MIGGVRQASTLAEHCADIGKASRVCWVSLSIFAFDIGPVLILLVVLLYSVMIILMIVSLTVENNHVFCFYKCLFRSL